MSADGGGTAARVAIDTNVLMDEAALLSLLLAADRGLLRPIWSPQLIGELGRAGLWRLGTRSPGRRSISTLQYRDYRELLYDRIHRIDLRFEIVRVAPIVAIEEEAAWAAAADPDDLHLQLLARTAHADCVVSWNHRHFPDRHVLDGRPCGQLAGVLWITPDQLPSLRLPALEVAS